MTEKMLFIFNFFKKRPAFLVFFVTFLIYSPVLFNQYIGDDQSVFERNTFYHTWKNIPRLFGKDYISNIREMELHFDSPADLGPGRNTYRPISNLTYFLDYYLFQAKPYGSHLINILIHCVNSILVFLVVNRIFLSSILGLFAALLFSLHPIQSEAVAVMSYRADIFTAMLVLSSFYFWIKFKQGGYVSKKHYVGSLVMCFFALFSKESAFILPFVILMSDRLLRGPVLELKKRAMVYTGFILILFFYLYLYLFVFPSPLVSFHWIGGSWINHCLEIGYIWYSYLINVLMPWTVKTIPGQYKPPIPQVLSLATAGMGIVLIVFIIGMYRLWSNYKKCFFFLLWHVVFYLPVSNLIPIANPMAYRFMYLPSIGLLIVLAFFLHETFQNHLFRAYSRSLSNILHGGVILICITRTLFLNNDFRSDYDVGSAWVRDYPAFGQGYALLGSVYFNAGLLKEAESNFEKSVLLGDHLPRELLFLAECYIRLGEIKRAQALLGQIILNFPYYDEPYFDLGQIYHSQNNNMKAKEALEKALELNPNFEAAKNLLGKLKSNG
ncbi:MAG: tetratricopeptide repeat protein [Candidatus Omnitrophica bacterium]|nr:tetratricopeptide repeat protein [Candidatus Omnitrophota bacterium]